VEIIGDFLIGLALGGHHGQRELVGGQQVGHLVGRYRIMYLCSSMPEAHYMLRDSLVQLRLLVADMLFHQPLQGPVMPDKRLDIAMGLGGPQGVEEEAVSLFKTGQAHGRHGSHQVQIDAHELVTVSGHEQGL